jgi:nitrogen fixation protein NifU and related proteins
MMVGAVELELDDLYRDIILDHYQDPRHHSPLAHPTCSLEGENPLCGDQITVHTLIADGAVADIAFSGRGCSISQASSSMMTECVKGKSLAETRALIGQFKEMMLKNAAPTEALGDLEALQGVRKFPVRVKCATLAWNVLERILNTHAQGDPS